jgi:hypothetical protein
VTVHIVYAFVMSGRNELCTNSELFPTKARPFDPPLATGPRPGKFAASGRATKLFPLLSSQPHTSPPGLTPSVDGSLLSSHSPHGNPYAARHVLALPWKSGDGGGAGGGGGGEGGGGGGEGGGRGGGFGLGGGGPGGGAGGEGGGERRHDCSLHWYRDRICAPLSAAPYTLNSSMHPVKYAKGVAYNAAPLKVYIALAPTVTARATGEGDD